MPWRDRRGRDEMAPAAKSYMKVAMDGKGISGDTIADWSAAWESVPSIEIAYVWHAPLNSSDVARGIERTGFQLEGDGRTFAEVKAERCELVAA
jgi:hypothetical protein